MKESNYNYFIDFLKFIFSIVIVIYHAWVFAYDYNSALFKAGYLAVDFYFIVTGYLMMNSIQKDKNSESSIGIKTIKFLYKKIKNIFPYILFAFVIGSILLYKDTGLTISVLTRNNYISEILQIGVLGLGFPINSATWYISSMLLSLMFLYPLALKYKDNYSTLIAPILLIIFLLICYSFNIKINNPIYKMGLGLNGLYKGFIFILLGNITYVLTNSFKKIPFNKLGRIILTIIEFILLLILLYTMNYNILGTIIVALITVILVIITFSNKSYTNKIFNFKILKELGKFGFIMFLNNIYFRTFLIQNDYSFRYRNFLILYVGLTIISSLVSYAVVPLFMKMFSKIRIILKKLLLTTEQNSWQ